MSADNYKVISPTEIYLGRTYGEWVSEFIGWLFSINPDQHNNGPVVFLKPIPTSPNPNYPGRMEPNIMVGNDRLQIFTDQAILIPVLLSYWATDDPNETETMLRERVRIDMINGDYPPRKDQISIDGREIQLNTDEDISDYLIESPLFTLIVPDAEYGKSLKDYVDYPLTPGVSQSVGTGYFFLVKFPKQGSYIVHSYARGHATVKGEYNEEFLYQIDVTDDTKKPQPPQRGRKPPQATDVLLARLKDKYDKHELKEEEYKKLEKIVEDSRNKNDSIIQSINLAMKAQLSMNRKDS